MDMSTLGIEAYEAKREALINDDRSFRRENTWKSQRSPAEIRADDCIRNLRAYEASTIWKVESDSIPHPFPGMEFLNGILFSELLYIIFVLANDAQEGISSSEPRYTGYCPRLVLHPVDPDSIIPHISDAQRRSIACPS